MELFHFLPEFMWRALLAGLGIALIAGPLGAFMVWQRLAYFGDTLAHASLLGISLSLAFHFNMSIGIIIVALLVALLLVSLGKTTWLASDTVLGILAHGCLALGLVALTLVQGPQIDILSYLYGDILAVSNDDILMIYVGILFIFSVMLFIWRSLLSITVHEELASVEGRAVQRVRLIYMCLLALVIALSIKIVGVLLMTALLIIPAATARRFASTPEQLAGIASIVGALAVLGGLSLSFYQDIPAGPAIVCMAVLFFLMGLLKSKIC